MKTRRRQPASKRLNTLEVFLGRRSHSISTITGDTVHCISEISSPDHADLVEVTANDTIVVDAVKINQQELAKHVEQANCGLFIHDTMQNIEPSTPFKGPFLRHILQLYVQTKRDFLPRILRETLLHIKQNKSFAELSFCKWGCHSLNVSGTAKELSKKLKTNLKDLRLNRQMIAPHKNILKNLSKAQFQTDEIKIHLDGTVMQMAMTVQSPKGVDALVAVLKSYSNAIVLLNPVDDSTCEIIAISDLHYTSHASGKGAASILIYQCNSEQPAAVKEAS